MDDHTLTITRRENAKPRLSADATVLSVVKRVLVDDEGQDLIEYALLAAFIGLAAIVATTELGTAVNSIYTRISSTLGTAGS